MVVVDNELKSEEMTVLKIWLLTMIHDLGFARGEGVDERGERIGGR